MIRYRASLAPVRENEPERPVARSRKGPKSLAEARADRVAQREQPAIVRNAKVEPTTPAPLKEHDPLASYSTHGTHGV